jgi:hypothetical protein
MSCFSDRSFGQGESTSRSPRQLTSERARSLIKPTRGGGSVADEHIDEARRSEEEEKERLREAQAEAKETLERAERLEEDTGDPVGE